MNVGGRVVKMERLRELFAELGLLDVRTFIQSGNVFFETKETDRAALTRKIEAHLLQRLGYEVPTFLRTEDELERALALDPFKDVQIAPGVGLCIMFVSRPLPAGVTLPVRSPKNDFEVLQATAGELFVVVRRVEGRVGNVAAFVEKAFDVKATARFFGTAGKILEAARGKGLPKR